MARNDPTARVKSLFFDKQAVTSRVDLATRRVLSKFGAHVRSDAKRSIRTPRGKKNTPSNPPSPPRNQTGKLKGGIYFSYEPSTRNVVIGPVLFARARNDNLVMLEHGGRRQMTVPKRGQTGKTIAVSATYPARPFMQPAFDKNKPKVAEMYRDQVR